MLTKNFSKVIAGLSQNGNATYIDRFGDTTASYKVDLSKITGINQYNLTYLESRSGSYFNYCTFSLGNGTATTSFDDISMAINPKLPTSENNPSTIFSDTDFTINNYQKTVTDDKITVSQTLTYSGSTKITVSEIGLFYVTYQPVSPPYTVGGALMAHEILETPIEINPNDVFTVSLSIG